MTAWYANSTDQVLEFRSESIGPDACRVDLALSSNKTINELFLRLATALTRQTMKWATHAVEGTIRSIETFVHVRWAWMALPITMNVCGAVFLVFVALQSHAAKLPRWNWSNLGLLYHGLVSEAVDTSSSHRTTSGMDVMASAARVRLRRSATEPGGRMVLERQAEERLTFLEDVAGYSLTIKISGMD